MKTYSEKLRDPRWQRRRLEIMERDNFTCLSCGAKDRTLNVHHAFYKRGSDPWEYEDHLLSTHCENCHKAIEHHVKTCQIAAAESVSSAEILSWLAVAMATDLKWTLGMVASYIRAQFDYWERRTPADHFALLCQLDDLSEAINWTRKLEIERPELAANPVPVKSLDQLIDDAQEEPETTEA